MADDTRMTARTAARISGQPTIGPRPCLKPAAPAGRAASASFDDLGEGAVSGETHNLDFLLDIPLEVTVELGRTSMIINNLLQLTQGSVVELNKAAADTVEIYVNHKLLGKGEVIIVNERFGVRITEIISQAERIKNMS